jgi:NAD-dependent DNA ligase
MTDFFVRQSAAFKNDMSRSLGALLGITQGLICDGNLNDREIHFLNDWLTANENIANSFPGDIVHARLKAVIADGVITDEERSYLTDTLQKLVGGSLDELAEPAHVTELAFDVVDTLAFQATRFCLTGNFVFAKKDVCHDAIERRGGLIADNVSKKLHYLVVGGLGSAEWKHGSFGTKVEAAMKLKREGAVLRIIREDHWANALSLCPVTAAGV